MSADFTCTEKLRDVLSGETDGVIKAFRDNSANAEERQVCNEILAYRESQAKNKLLDSARGFEPDKSAEQRNAFWSDAIRRGGEFRAGLGEDTTSGAGAGSSLVPTLVSGSVVDLLRANTILDKVGAQFFDMSSERVNVPVYTSDVAPAWVAENTSVNLDGNPSFSTLPFSATGAYTDITLLSRQVVEDAVTNGGIAEFIEQTIAKKYARLVDSVFYAGTAGNAGNPGFLNETGVVTQSLGTNGATPTDTSFLSTAAQSVRNANAEPNAFVMNPTAAGTIERLKASTYAKYWDLPQSIADIPWVISTALPQTETAGTSSATSSILTGDFRNVMVGMRHALDVDILRERYADQNAIGIRSYMRFSIRLAHPETFVRVSGFLGA